MERFSIEEFTDQSQWVVQLRSFLAEIQRAKYILKSSQLFYIILGVFYCVSCSWKLWGILVNRPQVQQGSESVLSSSVSCQAVTAHLTAIIIPNINNFTQNL